MKFIFFGTPEFAAIILEKLIQAELMPEAVICNPDKPTGRKQIITPPLVKVLAQKYGLTVYQPKDKTELLEIVKNLQPDLAVTAAFGMIFPKEILEIPKYGFINVHPSLLPKYRGPTPIQTAILNGDKETGVSLFLIDEEMDHGPILAKRELEFPISNFQFPILSQKLAELGADLLIETLPKYINGEIKPQAQDESQATYTKKFSTQDAYIEPKDLEIAQEKGGDKAIEIERKIRALNPEPGTFTLSLSKGGLKRTKLLEAKIIDEKLKITKIQVEGKKPQNICGVV
ncbi:methionyl-tRNA formyltransferase [Candidatus Wolfebacteria bacterium CG1_02_39_135]|uniref:Methionyl-tRNA formyltransferase n=1 Tax=Candidatus Wolfebacteria bacterium CG1_02_39_135 TaxID=1805425 RepID=A0A1J4XSW9_9BACT|nr:MAG: methionyl-tRNA formyltransferase [Candidatus Wolfebacteria bacterium CG1_02_39_135]